MSQTADQVWVRKINRAIILQVFRTHPTLSRARLAAETGLNPSTVSSIIGELIQEDLIRETDLIQSRTGRPGRLLELNPEGGCALGIEINVDYIEFLITDFAANVLWRQKQSIAPEIGQEEIMAQVSHLAKKASAFVQARKSHLLGVGVGVPGLVDVSSGLLRIAPNLHWADIPIRDVLAKHFDCPIYVENEANAAALGEYYFGAVRNVKDFIYLSAGIGLGSGIVIGGKLFKGMFGYAGEAGHMTLDVNGELCGCGKHGCWETFVGPRAVEQRVQSSLACGAKSIMTEMVKGDIQNIVFDDVLKAAKMGDQTAMDALAKVAFYLGIGIANLVNLFNVEVIVLGGALNNASSFILADIECVAWANTLAPEREHLRIIPSAHGTDACVMGAIALVLDDILCEPVF
ncbi:MAG: ROK family transcriptional regulator [Anaerolineaceae bacterium]|nr:ROK family transcriptional regulator [Anaerolineaceae bacterium]